MSLILAASFTQWHLFSGFEGSSSRGFIQRRMSRVALTSLPQAIIVRISCFSCVDFTVRAKLGTLGSGKDPCSLSDRMPIAVDDLLAFLVGMVLSGPAQQQMAYQFVISTQAVY